MNGPIAIHRSRGFFTERWVEYCERMKIPYKLVDCHRSDIVRQLLGCSALLYNHHQANPVDVLMARPLLFAMEHAGLPVFPDFKTNWHFDDKVGQKYLFEALAIPEQIPTWVFYSQRAAMEWVESAKFPKVFKLRVGAGSQHVHLVKTSADARRLVRRAFGRGFALYNGWGSLKERYRKFRSGSVTAMEVIKGVVRLVRPPRFARTLGRAKGYIYFQEFIPGNTFDIRVIVIDNKAFALKRYTRPGDFRASGSGLFEFGREVFREEVIKLAFTTTQRLQAQCVAYDFIYDENEQPRIVEINYGFWPGGYDQCPGYWDDKLDWHEGKFDPYGWMIEMIRKACSVNRSSHFTGNSADGLK